MALAPLFLIGAAVNAHDCDLNYDVKTIDGTSVNLEEYEGKVVVAVNVASRCGATPQYEDLQALYEKYGDQGLVVLGFPCNQFGGQEPGTEADILEFCTSKYNVTFPMFSKLEVNGDGAHPFYKNLTSKNVKPAGSGRVGWNFEKFVIGRDGNVLARFQTRTKPTDPSFIATIEKALQTK